MSRLTQKDDQGNWCLKDVPWKDLHEGSKITKEMREKLYGALWKLMEYEDTGLSPEDVERVNDFGNSQAALYLGKYQEERRKHQWIPVKERLPEEEGFVLVQVSGRPKHSILLVNALQLAEYDPDEGWILEMYPEWIGALPVAWMPLPEAYRPEEIMHET